MMRLAAIVSMMLLAYAGAIAPARAQSTAPTQSRVALVIGNSTYQNVAQLPNTLNDANDVAASLGRLGFSVSRLENADFNAMRVGLRDFGRRAQSAEMAVVYFAGHGMEVGGENWLIPVDAELKTDIDAEDEAIGLKTATLAVSGASKLGLVILDACRNNPFAASMQRTSRQRAVTRGLARVEPTGNVLIAYAAKDGTTADDGSGRNSPFTAALLRSIEMPGLEVQFMFRNVRDDVMDATHGAQQPFTYGSLSKELVYLKPEPAKPELRADPLAAARARWSNWTLTPQIGHSLPVIAIAASPDGRRIASASLDMTVKVWAADSGRLLRTLVGHAAPLTSVAFSPDGRRLASASLDSQIKVWDVESGQAVKTFAATPPTLVTSLTFTLDGRQILLGDADGRIRFVDVETGQGGQTIGDRGKAVFSVAFSRDHRLIVSAGFDNTVKVWDARTLKLVQTLEGHAAPVVSAAFSPDGSAVVSGSLDRSIKLWDVETGKLKRTLGIHSASVLSAAFSRDGRRIASGSLDGVVKVWDATTFQLVRSLKAHPGQSPDIAMLLSGAITASATKDFSDLVTQGMSWLLSGSVPGVYSLTFSFDGRQIISSGGDASIKAWDIGNGELVRSFDGASDASLAVAFSPDGRRIAAGGFDKSIKLWDAATLQRRATLAGHTGIVTAVAFSPDGRRLASASFDSTIRIWSAETGELEGVLEGHLGAVTSLAFSPDGRRIISGSLDKTVRIWDADTLAPAGVLEGHELGVMAVAVSPDGRRIASGSIDESVKLWDAGSQKNVASSEDFAAPVLSLAFSPDGRKIAATFIEGGVNLLDAETVKVLSTLDGPKIDGPKIDGPNDMREFLRSVSFSPDGRRLAAGGVHRTIWIWDPETGKVVQTLDGHGSVVAAVGFSPDGRRVVSAGSFDKTVRLWEVASGKPIASLIGLGPDNTVALGADGGFSASAAAFDHLSLVRGLEAVAVPDDYKAAFMRERSLDEIAAAAH